MNKTLKWILSILVFLVMLPISYILSCLMLLWYQGNGFNGIFQFGIIVVLVIGLSFAAAKSLYDKLG